MIGPLSIDLESDGIVEPKGFTGARRSATLSVPPGNRLSIDIFVASFFVDHIRHVGSIDTNCELNLRGLRDGFWLIDAFCDCCLVRQTVRMALTDRQRQVPGIARRNRSAGHSPRVNSAGSFAMLAAMRRASSSVRTFACRASASFAQL
jgi:hypothetical protein